MNPKVLIITLLLLSQASTAGQDTCLFYPCQALWQNVINGQLTNLQQQYFNHYGGGQPLYYPGQENYYYPGEHVWFEDPIPRSRLPEYRKRKRKRSRITPLEDVADSVAQEERASTIEKGKAKAIRQPKRKKRQVEDKLSKQVLHKRLTTQCKEQEIKEIQKNAIELSSQLNDVTSQIGRFQGCRRQTIKWNAGCEVLEKPDEGKIDQLFETCLASLRNTILDGVISGRGEKVKIDRIKLFANMKDENKLNVVEKNFLAMVFTAHAETRGMHKIYKPKEKAIEQETERFQNVMKVIANRLRWVRANKDGTADAMDIVLDNKQFSPYNPADGPGGNTISYNFLQTLHYDSCHAPANKASMKRATRAYIRHLRGGGASRPDNVYHFYARTIEPPYWHTDGRPVEQGLMKKDIHHVFLANINFPYHGNIALGQWEFFGVAFL